MAKAFTEIKQLYTLNDSKLSSEEDLSESDSSIDEREADNELDYQDVQKENKKLIKKNQELQRAIADWQLKNQQLFELNQLAEKRNLKHEEKQRDLIKKLSYFQVNNKQMAYEIKKLSQDMQDTRQNKKVSQNQMTEVKHVIKKSLYQKDKFLGFLKNILQMLKKCEKPQEYQIEQDKIIQFIQKNISNSQGNNKINCQFDLKFQLSRVDTLKQKIKSLEKELQTAYQLIDKEKIERKKIIGVYNEKINKFRQLYDSLRGKIQSQEDESRRKIKAVILQKNQIIDSLKNKLKQSRTRKSSFDIKKSRESKKSFIGDGQFSHLELNELNEAIENLQMQIIKEFEE